MNRIFLDDAGGSAILPEVLAAVRELPHGNPSSPHTEGRAARSALDRARDVLAQALGADRTEVSFTSSGTEAVNLALSGAARRLPRSGRIVTWAAEHQAVLGSARRLQADGYEVEIGAVDGDARIDPDVIDAGVALVSIGLANNEVGTIQPVREVIDRAHERGALVHVDACAGPRWIPIPGGADLLSISGHKLGAGRGGALFVRTGVRIDPLIYGGPQEWGRRAGREDIASAVACATALAVCSRERELRSRTAARHSAALREVVVELGARLTGADKRLPNLTSCAFDDRKGEDMLLALDLAGIAASSGSACASGSLDPSHVLLAMGLSLTTAMGSLRLSAGYDTTDEEIARARDVITTVLTRSPARA